MRTDFTMTGPTITHPGAELTFTGSLKTTLSTQYIREEIPTGGSIGIPFQTVDLLVDGTMAGSTTTDDAGRYSFKVTLESLGTHSVQAVTYRGTPLATFASGSLSVLVMKPVQISSGYTHSCARLSDGTTGCWGANDYGQLGNGTASGSSAAVVSGLSGATAISAGGYHTCASLPNGSVSCWGHNGSGQLGDGTTTNSTAPVTVSGLSGATAISAGSYQTCALLSNGTVSCWRYDSTAPVAVSGSRGSWRSHREVATRARSSRAKRCTAGAATRTANAATVRPAQARSSSSPSASRAWYRRDEKRLTRASALTLAMTALLGFLSVVPA